MAEYVDYYHNDRTHLALNKDTPAGRSVEQKPSDDADINTNAKIVSLPRLGGLHHRYTWQEKKKKDQKQAA